MKLIDAMPQLNIGHIDVYGDGTCKEQLIRYVADKNLSEKVSFCGYRDDLYEYLDGKYNGIIGLGRVVIEGLSMGYPVLLLGHRNMFGILDNQMVQTLQIFNFSPLRLQPLSDLEQLNRQLNDVYRNLSAYDMRSVMESGCDIKVLAAKYIHELETTPFHTRINLIDFYNSLCQLAALDEPFYQCKSVSILTQKFVEYYSAYGDIKNLFLLQRTEDLLNSQLVNHVNGLNWRIDQSQNLINEIRNTQEMLAIQINQLKAEIDGNIRIYLRIKRFLKKIKNHFSPKKSEATSFERIDA